MKSVSILEVLWWDIRVSRWRGGKYAIKLHCCLPTCVYRGCVHVSIKREREKERGSIRKFFSIRFFIFDR